MPPDLNKRDINEAVQRMFLAAFLLTGSAAGAEYVVQESISNADGANVSCEAAFQAMLLAAVATRPARFQQQETELLSLPAELRGVLLLPPELRQSFVLRLLLGLSVSQCSKMLSLDARQVESNAVSAALALAGARGKDGRGASGSFGNV